MSTENNIRIPLLPIVIIISVLTFIVGLGFFWDLSRTDKKLAELKSHAQDIYTAHQKDIIKIALDDKSVLSSSGTLRDINRPENNLRTVYIIRKKGDKWEIVNQWNSDIAIDDMEAKNLSKETNPNETTATANEVIKPGNRTSWEHYQLTAFVPIKSGDELVGYLVVTRSKTGNF